MNKGIKYVIRIDEKCDMYFKHFDDVKEALQIINVDCNVMLINPIWGYCENMHIGRKDGKIYGLD